MKILKYLLLFIFLNYNYLYAKNNIIFVDLDRLKNLIYIKNNSKLIDTPTGKMVIKMDNIREVYQIPSKEFYTQLRYINHSNTRVSGDYRGFLDSWAKAKYNNSEDVSSISNINTMDLLDQEQVEIFFDEMTFMHKGKTVNFLVQKTVAKKLKNYKSNQDIIVKLVTLGYSVDKDRIYAIISDFYDEKPKDLNEYEDNLEYYKQAKQSLKNNSFDMSISKLKRISLKNPKNIQLKNDICAAEFTKSISLRNLKVSSIEECYKNILELDPNSIEAYYGLASLYYMDKEGFKKSAIKKNIFEYTSKVISLIQNKDSVSDVEVDIYHKSLYLRGLVKIELKDPTAFEDLRKLENERPDLINTDFLKRK